MQDLDPSDICKKKFLNPLKRIRVIIRTPTHGRTDGRTDGQTDRQTDGRTGWIQYTPTKLRFGGYNDIANRNMFCGWCSSPHTLTNMIPVQIPDSLPEASFGLWVLSLPVPVCLCVLVCVNQKFVCTITHHLFKLGSPNLDPICERLYDLYCFVGWLTLIFTVKFKTLIFTVKFNSQVQILNLSMQ